MKVTSLSTQYLPKKMLNSTQRLLQRMNQTTKRQEIRSGMKFISEITHSIKINDFLILKDLSFFTAPVKKDVLMKGTANLILREPNVSVTFDKKSGEILSIEPPYMTAPIYLQDIFKKMKKHLNQAECVFEKNGVVQKNTLKFEGYTAKFNELDKRPEVIIEPNYELLKQNCKKKSLLQKVAETIDVFFTGR